MIYGPARGGVDGHAIPAASGSVGLTVRLAAAGPNGVVSVSGRKVKQESAHTVSYIHRSRVSKDVIATLGVAGAKACRRHS